MKLTNVDVYEYDGELYALSKVEKKTYDIYSFADNKYFATHIHEQMIDDTIEKYQTNKWCNICEGDGTLEDFEGNTVVCYDCNN